ncbi:hypothetical protein E3N88_36919 [Mikania micrantha]|uniref:Protein TILLER ANGLE CONTROL 1 n=1 Tax=Mikania micrantha TaxID=192012 RepID=A0A5N6M537_9ASTR|nr:hypothetical protein E3N88_36919 [Mikania micrantha]
MANAIISFNLFRQDSSGYKPTFYMVKDMKLAVKFTAQLRYFQDEVSEDVKKAENTANGKDNLSLLAGNEAMDNVLTFDGWKEGIFAIGTFGFDPSLLKEFENEEEAYLCEYTRQELSVDDEDNNIGVDQEEEIEFPLVFKACNHGFFHDHQKDDDDMTQFDEISKADVHEDGVDDTDQMKKGKKAADQRTTLADLFWADSDKNNLLNKLKLADEDQAVKVHFSPESNTKHASYDHERAALISKKKIMKEDAARPIKKINRMMRKMLKKKIHPDIENQKEKCVFEAIHACT